MNKKFSSILIGVSALGYLGIFTPNHASSIPTCFDIKTEAECVKTDSCEWVKPGNGRCSGGDPSCKGLPVPSVCSAEAQRAGCVWDYRTGCLPSQ